MLSVIINGNNIEEIYNAIEKELLKENYSVRDRGLFNELLSKAQTTDYSKIKELTNTDIILEVVNIDPSVVYTTNRVTLVGSKKDTENILFRKKSWVDAWSRYLKQKLLSIFLAFQGALIIPTAIR